MQHRDGIFASLALAAGVAMMAGPPQIMPLQAGTKGLALLVSGEAWQ